MRASYGLAGIVYEATFKIKPIEIIRFDYQLHHARDLTEDLITNVIAANQSIVCWTIGHTVVIQTRNRATELRHEWLGEARRFGWNFLAAFSGRAMRQHTPGPALTHLTEDLGAEIELGFYKLLNAMGGFTLYDPDKIVNYSSTPPSARYAFTFWAFPRGDWVKNLKAYLEFSDNHFKQHASSRIRSPVRDC